MAVTDILMLYGVLLVSLVVHEASHAWVAYLGGDMTAYEGGQVTLNPVPHIRREPFGTVILPLAMLFMSKGQMLFGYAHAPVDPLWAHRHPKRAAMMAAAGPLSNFLLAGLALLGMYLLVHFEVAKPRSAPGELMRFVDPLDKNSGAALAACKMVSTFYLLNILLGLFNLVPLPPLDGSAILEGLFPKLGNVYGMLRTQPIIMLVVIFVLVNSCFQYVWTVARAGYFMVF